MAKKKTILNLTEREQEIINHRLWDWDAIVEVFNDSYEDMGMERPWDEDDVIYCCQALIEGDLEKAEDRDKKLTRDLLIEAIDGNTWAVNAYENESPQKFASTCKTCYSVTAKIAEYTEHDDLEMRIG